MKQVSKKRIDFVQIASPPAEILRNVINEYLWLSASSASMHPSLKHSGLCNVTLPAAPRPNLLTFPSSRRFMCAPLQARGSARENKEQHSCATSSERERRKGAG